MRRIVLLLSVCAAACGGGNTPSTSPSPQTTPVPPPNGARDVLIQMRTSETFSPRSGVAALHDFVPEAPAVDDEGECTLSRTAGSGATTVYAYYPKRVGSRMSISITFDSAGHLVRYSENRGRAMGVMPPNATPAQRDSVLRTSEAVQRSTSVTLDYPVDRAMVINRGAGRPTDAVMGTVRDVEAMEKLGLRDRMTRVRKLCGV